MNYVVGLKIAFIVVMVILVVLLAIKVIQKLGLEKVREIAYQGFIIAENEFLHGENTDKFNFVVNLVRDSVPQPFKVFITESLLRIVIEDWFKLCKDLLDDGRINNK